MITNQIKIDRYCLKEAFGQVPSGRLNEAKEFVSKILGLSSPSQVWYYIKGKSQPSIGEAIAIERYFKETFGITDAWNIVKSEPILSK